MVKQLFLKLGITNKAEFWKFVAQFVKFGLVGVSNTAVSLGCYYAVLYFNEEWYLVGSIVGTIVSIANAFFWNDKFVFKGKHGSITEKLKRLGKTYVSYGGTSLLSVVLLWIEVDYLGLSKSIAPIVNIAIMTPINFLINKFWTFKECKR